MNAETLTSSSPFPPDYKCCIAVEGIPILSPEDFEKVQAEFVNVFSFPNPPVSTKFPIDEKTGKTKPYCFIEYETPFAASSVAGLLHNCKYDEHHTLSVCTIDSQRPEVNSADNNDLWWWLQNPTCSNQFATQSESPDGTTLSIYRHSEGDVPQLINREASRLDWSEMIFKWSPYGTYLATCHADGIAIWGGEKFEKLQEMCHPKITYFDFSPCETYLITFAYEDNRLRIFEVVTGKLKVNIKPQIDGATVMNRWPFLKWSHDEKYFALCRDNSGTVNVYDAESWSLQSRLQLPGLVSFEWNPKRYIIAYYCEEQTDTPAEIGIYNYAIEQKISVQHISSVSSASLYWQKDGNYLAANTERFDFNDVRNSEIERSSHLDIFDCTGQEVSVQSFQLPGKFISLEFEPNGTKFAVIVDSDEENKVTPLIYRISPEEPKLLTDFYNLGYQLSHINWAPQGGWLVMHSKDTYTGQTVFIDATGDDVTHHQVIWHRGMNYGEWDPTGQYFITASTGNKKFKTGYRIHTFKGQEVYEKATEGLTRITWRPRPPCPVDEMKNFKAFRFMFEQHFLYAHKFFENRIGEESTMTVSEEDFIQPTFERPRPIVVELGEFCKAVIERRKEKRSH